MPKLHGAAYQAKKMPRLDVVGHVKSDSFMKIFLLSLLATLTAAAQQGGAPVSKFQQLDQTAPTPSAQRIASGAPGAGYWQNTADYDINVELDDVKRTISADATVTYHNASPDALTYLWVQLDQNYLSHNADSRLVPNSKRGIDPSKVGYSALDRMLTYESYDGEMKISKLTDAQGATLPNSMVKTMLRIDLPQPMLLARFTTFVKAVARVSSSPSSEMQDIAQKVPVPGPKKPS
jgi:hypothetical protein